MEKLNKVKVSSLTKDCFDKYPVWAWDDKEESQCPIKLEGNILPDDLGTLFIKANMKTKNGAEFNGYVIGLVSFYCFAIFVNNEKFMFNLTLTDFVNIEMSKFLSQLQTDAVTIFPVSYHTNFQFPDNRKVSGAFYLDT